LVIAIKGVKTTGRGELFAIVNPASNKAVLDAADDDA